MGARSFPPSGAMRACLDRKVWRAQPSAALTAHTSRLSLSAGPPAMPQLGRKPQARATALCGRSGPPPAAASRGQRNAIPPAPPTHPSTPAYPPPPYPRPPRILWKPWSCACAPREASPGAPPSSATAALNLCAAPTWRPGWRPRPTCWTVGPAMVRLEGGGRGRGGWRRHGAWSTQCSGSGQARPAPHHRPPPPTPSPYISSPQARRPRRRGGRPADASRRAAPLRAGVPQAPPRHGPGGQVAQAHVHEPATGKGVVWEGAGGGGGGGCGRRGTARRHEGLGSA